MPSNAQALSLSRCPSATRRRDELRLPDTEKWDTEVKYLPKGLGSGCRGYPIFTTVASGSSRLSQGCQREPCSVLLSIFLFVCEKQTLSTNRLTALDSLSSIRDMQTSCLCAAAAAAAPSSTCTERWPHRPVTTMFNSGVRQTALRAGGTSVLHHKAQDVHCIPSVFFGEQRFFLLRVRGGFLFS